MPSPGIDPAPLDERLHPERVGHAWPRELLLRGLGLVYAVAYAVLVHQALPLFGRDGLTPADLWLARVAEARGGAWEGAQVLPTLFWLDSSDGALAAAAWVGLLLSLAVVAGLRNAVVMALVWALYLSFVGVGQLWLGYGWESLLCEAGFLAIFLCPLRAWRPSSPVPAGTALVVWLYRWLLVRLMLGAGLIKLRGDPCWRELTCLQWHYETQPNPHPLSWLWHQLPPAAHSAGVAFNHLVELVCPLLLLAPRPARLVAAGLTALFQVFLILSGNLSFFNWLTLVLCLSCLDDRAVARLTGRTPPGAHRAPSNAGPWHRARLATLASLALLVGVLSFDPIANLAGRDQAMNTSHDPLRLVNSYGAFGSVHRQRVEVVLQGRRGDGPWLEYELPCKPGRVDRAPCLVTPYHLRLDWQLWFVQFSPDIDRHPWLVHLAWKLLRGEPGIRRLLAHDPFDGAAPDELRLALFEYRFTRPGEDGWWIRTPLGILLPPVRADDPALRAYVEERGWPL